MRFSSSILVAVTLATVLGSNSASSAQRVPNIRVTHDRFGAHMEPSLAVNPANPRNLLGAASYLPAAHDFNGGRVPGTFVSFDGGGTWHDNGQLLLPTGYTAGSNTSIAFTPRGVGVVVARVDSGPDRTGIAVWRTTDGGRHFAAPLVEAQGNASENVDHPWIAAGAGESAHLLYLAWSVSGPRHNGIAFSRSADGGLHFGPGRSITGGVQRADVAPVVTAGPAGQVVVVYADLGPTTKGVDSAANIQHAAITAVRSADGGRTFGAPRHLAAATMGNVSARPLPQYAFPATATDPHDGSLYVSFTRVRPGTASPQIVIARSRDGGNTWLLLEPIAGGPVAGRIAYLQPQLTVTAHGTVALSYFAVIHGRVDLYLARSQDHGAHFGAGIRVTTTSWNPTLGVSIGNRQFWIGDYQALTAGPRTIYLCWNDTRTKRLEIYGAVVPQ